MKKLCFFFLLGLMAAALAAPAFAAPQCYSPADLQAEEVLRLHSELMVIAVTCRQGSRGQDLVSAYTGFTRDNIGMLRQAEQTMIHYYQGTVGGDGIASLDELRTKLGNEYGQMSADASAPVFCQRMRDMVLNYYYATPLQIADTVQSMMATVKSYEHLCNYKAAKTAVQPAAGLGVSTSTNYVGGNAADLVARN
jgi:hypothetical protein